MLTGVILWPVVPIHVHSDRKLHLGAHRRGVCSRPVRLRRTLLPVQPLLLRGSGRAAACSRAATPALLLARRRLLGQRGQQQIVCQLVAPLLFLLAASQARLGLCSKVGKCQPHGEYIGEPPGTP